jgi:hypothetical protein
MAGGWGGKNPPTGVHSQKKAIPTEETTESE